MVVGGSVHSIAPIKQGFLNGKFRNKEKIKFPKINS